MKSSLIIFLIGFLTIAPSIYVGAKYFDGKVVDQPYESGLTYNADKKFISENGLGLTIIKNAKTGNNVDLQFSFDKNKEVELGETSFFLTRPATNQEKIQIKVEKTVDGIYASAFELNTYGHYILKAITTANGKRVAIQKSLYIN
ncbi:MAG: hypothetical protein C0603_02710 [Denitrovibrio sp.]|nr:MAG: hypothetical protein C0603_02710 [Denitrovibrio sp.]